jgi:hypothetical protein
MPAKRVGPLDVTHAVRGHVHAGCQPRGGGPFHFSEEKLPDGALNPQRGLVQYRNGSTERPQPDDLLVFTDTKYGHVGIMTEAGENAMEIIQQNIVGHTRQQFSLSETNGHTSSPHYESPRVGCGCPVVHELRRENRNEQLKRARQPFYRTPAH